MSSAGIGQRLRAARLALGLRQADVAARVGMANSHISDIERGAMTPTIPTLQKICDALDRPLEYALAGASSGTRSLGMVIYRMSLGELSATWFAQTLAKKTGGALTAQIYSQVVPGEIYEQVQGLVDGSIHMLIDDLLSLERYAPMCAQAMLPYFFRGGDHYRRFLKSSIFQTEVRERLLAQGIRILNPLQAAETRAFELLFTNRPVFQPRDLVGMRWRSYASEPAIALRRALGAQPVHVYWNEAAAALASGEIEAFLLPAHHHASLELHRVAQYVTRLSYGYVPSLVMAINEHEYRKLSPDWQAALNQTVAETEAHFAQAVDQHSTAYVHMLSSEYGVAVIEPDPRIWAEAFQTAIAQVNAQVPGLSPEMFAALQAL